MKEEHCQHVYEVIRFGTPIRVPQAHAERVIVNVLFTILEGLSPSYRITLNNVNKQVWTRLIRPDYVITYSIYG